MKLNEQVKQLSEDKKSFSSYINSLLFRVHKEMQNRDSELSFNDYLAQEKILKEIQEWLKK